MADTRFVGANMVPAQSTEAIDPSYEPPLVEGGAFSDIEIYAQHGVVVKTDRHLMNLEEAAARKRDLEEYAARFRGTSIQLSPLIGVRIDAEGQGYRVRHAVEYVQGHSVLSIARESSGARRAMASEVVTAVMRMPSMPNNWDQMPVGLDLVERNIQVAGIQSRTPGQLVLVDMTPPVLRYADGSLNVRGDARYVHFFDRYFATKSGAIARYLVGAFWPIPLKSDTLEFAVEKFAAGLTDVIPRQLYGPVLEALKSFATEECDRLGEVACQGTIPAQADQR